MAKTTEAPVKRYKRWLNWQITWFVSLSCLLGIILGLSWVVQHSHIRQDVIAYNAVRNHNEFWTLAAGPSRPETGWRGLAIAIQPFLNGKVTSAPPTPLLPQRLQDVDVPSGLFGNVCDKISIDVFQPDSSRACTNSGFFSPSFLHEADLVGEGKLNDVLQSVPAPPSRKIVLSPFGVPEVPFLAAAFLLFSWIAIALGLTVAAGDLWDGEHLTLDLTGTADRQKLIIMTLCPVPFSVSPVWRIPAKLFRRYKTHREEIVKARELEKVNWANPVYDQLREARQRLANLMALNPNVRKTPGVKKAIADTEHLIEELANFPTTVSKEAAAILVKSYTDQNEDARTRANAILDARKELEQM